MANKKRLIDAIALKEKATNMITMDSIGEKQHLCVDAVRTAEIEKAPTVDEIVYGKWIDRGYEIECPFCGFICNDTHYFGKAIACPNCAARMDG